jgi:predicted DNA-binding protein
MKKMDSQVATRFPSKTCEQLKNAAAKFQLPQSVLLRAVVREGLKVVIEHGIRIEEDER